MSLLILITGILVSIVFDRQQRRHRMDLMWEYKRLNIPMPVPKPKLSAPLVWLNIVLGALLTAFGSFSVVMMLHTPITLNHRSLTTAEFFIGCGITLIVLGSKAFMELRAYHHRGA